MLDQIASAETEGGLKKTETSGSSIPEKRLQEPGEEESDLVARIRQMDTDDDNPDKIFQVIAEQKKTEFQAEDSIRSSLREILQLFTTKEVIFPPEVKRSPEEASTISLATHGQRLEHLMGSEKTQGLIQSVAKNGLSSWKLLSKEENNFEGVPVEAYSSFGGGAAGEEGEARISFYVNDLAGFGEVNWVMPVGTVIGKGGIVGLFYDPTETSVDFSLKGMHAKTGEFGFYSPLGCCLESKQRGEKALDIIESRLKRTHITKEEIDPTVFIKSFLLNYTKYSDMEPQEGREEYIQRKIGKRSPELTKDDLVRFLNIEQERQKIIVEKSLRLVKTNKDFQGVDLFNSTAICFIPEEKMTEIKEKINALTNLTDKQRQFMRQQMIPYDTSDELALSERITDLSQHPEKYAELILQNMRLLLDNPELITEDVVVLLKEQELKIGEDRFARLGSRKGLYAVKPMNPLIQSSPKTA